MGLYYKNVQEEQQVHEVVITNSNGELMTDTINIAEVTGKMHKHILDKIRTFPEDFTERNFSLSTYSDPTGRQLPMFNMTRRGMTTLVMSFTGPKVWDWQQKYHDAFDMMEEELTKAPKFTVPTNMLEAMTLATEQMGRAEELQEMAKSLGTTAIRFNK